jgi:hypothetical protein
MPAPMPWEAPVMTDFGWLLRRVHLTRYVS